jgi:thiaminase (transcriptional activator TenA)
MKLLTLALVAAPLFAKPLVAGDTGFTGELWGGIAPIYANTLKHPYLTGLADGTLPRDRFEFYLQQDALYLNTFSEVLKILSSKAPREDWRKTLMKHATEAIDTERQLHESILKGKKAEQMAPTNYAYTNHLLATAARRPFAEGLAASLPCYWIYQEVGQELKKRGSRNPDYQRWIDQYSDDSYREAVHEVLEMMNAEAQRLDPPGRERLKHLFTISARYEYMFWDMAWRKERWLP